MSRRLPAMLNEPPVQPLGNRHTGVRRAAVVAVLEAGPARIRQLVDETGYGGQSIWDDLMALKRAGLVKRRRPRVGPDVWRLS